MATADELDRVMAVLMATYPAFGENVPQSKLSLTVEMYHRLLRDIDGRLLMAAAEQHISACKWFPTIAELREAALALMTHDESSAEEAWIEVRRAIKTVGYYGVPSFSDEKITRTVKAFGWRDLCGYDTDQEGVTRAHFMRIYDSLKHKQHSDALMLPEVRTAIETQRQIVSDMIKRLAEKARS